MKKFYYLPITFLILSINVSAQITIKEKVKINPTNKIETAALQKDGNISGDIRNPAYIAYGGSVTLRPINRTNPYELWEEDLGKITPNSIIPLGVFPQWHKFIFYLLDTQTGEKFYPLEEQIVWDFSSIDFYPSHIDGESYPYNPEDWWEIQIDVDYSLVRTPPAEIFNYLGNLFVPSETIRVPVSGQLFAEISYVNTPAESELWMEFPANQMLLNNLEEHADDVLDLGEVNAGDLVRFYFRSPNSVVVGQNLYPRFYKTEEWFPDGTIHLGTLNFEDWTDELFDNLEMEIYFMPESINGIGPLAIFTDPQKVSQGDTVTITFKKQYLDGTLEEFDSDQGFEIGMVDGCVLGNLIVDGEEDSYFYDVMQPIKFVAADSIESDSNVVKVKAALVHAIIAGKLNTKNNNLRNSHLTKQGKSKDAAYKILKKKLMQNKQMKTLNKTDNVNAEFCFTGEFGSFAVEKNILIEENKIPELVVLSPTKDSPPDTISAEPKMPNVICKAQLKNYDKGEVTFEWNYIVTNKFERYKRIKGENITLCPRIDTTWFIGISHCYNDEITEWAVPFVKDSATFYYKGITHRDNACEKIVTTWNGANEVFTGGEVYIEVTAKDEFGKTIKSIAVIGNRIVGLNPEPDDVRSGLTLQEQVILYMESYPKWEQFNETNRNEYNQSGNPIYGYPNGFGLMQIDTPPATEVQLWNWRENIEAGKQLLDEKYSIANHIYLGIKKKYSNAQNYNNTELLKQTFQLYNGGKYYDWIPENAKDKNSSGKWIKSTNRTYGDTAWKVYSEVNNNNFPSDW